MVDEIRCPIRVGFSKSLVVIPDRFAEAQHRRYGMTSLGAPSAKTQENELVTHQPSSPIRYDMDVRPTRGHSEDVGFGEVSGSSSCCLWMQLEKFSAFHPRLPYEHAPIVTLEFTWIFQSSPGPVWQGEMDQQNICFAQTS